MTQPLIVSALFESEVQCMLDALRQQYFPKDRNWLSAHLTVFHAVPMGVRPKLHDVMLEATSGPRPAVRLAGIMSLGKGFAVKVESPALIAVHQKMRAVLWPHLGHQDRAPLRPHVTLQNKVTPERARADKNLVKSAFVAKNTSLVALQMWRYDDGPWSFLSDYPFQLELPG